MKRVLLLLVAAVVVSPAAHSERPARDANPEVNSARARYQNCPPSLPPQPDNIEGATSQVYKSAGRDLRIHVFPPSERGESAPAILFFFGGAWRTGSVMAFAEQARAFAERGYVAAVADYRVLCRDRSSPVDAVADAQAAYEWLRSHDKELHIDPNRIALAGASAGGHLALTVAMLAPRDRKPVAVALFNPAVDMISLIPLFGLPADAIRRISPSVLPTKDLPPTVAFHGTVDRLVPIDTVRNFCQRAKAGGRVCELHEYVGQDHSFFQSHSVDPRISASPYEDTLAKALTFVDRRVKAGAGK